VVEPEVEEMSEYEETWRAEKEYLETLTNF